MSELIQHLSQHLPPNQIIVDDLRRLAYGTDASFYRIDWVALRRLVSRRDIRTVVVAAQIGVTT